MRLVKGMESQTKEPVYHSVGTHDQRWSKLLVAGNATVCMPLKRSIHRDKYILAFIARLSFIFYCIYIITVCTLHN